MAEQINCLTMQTERRFNCESHCPSEFAELSKQISFLLASGFITDSVPLVYNMHYMFQYVVYNATSFQWHLILTHS